METHQLKKSVKNLQIASELFKFAYQIKYHQIKLKNPNLSHEELHKQTLKLFDRSLERPAIRGSSS